jgi:hypothetical protein
VGIHCVVSSKTTVPVPLPYRYRYRYYGTSSCPLKTCAAILYLARYRYRYTYYGSCPLNMRCHSGFYLDYRITGCARTKAYLGTPSSGARSRQLLLGNSKHQPRRQVTNTQPITSVRGLVTVQRRHTYDTSLREKEVFM